MPATMEFDVQPSPAGGWRVMLRGNPAPVSRHDTEDDARRAAASYARGTSASPGDVEAAQSAGGR